MRYIDLTQGQVAIVCDCHYELVEKYKWQARFNPTSNSFYAVRVPPLTERLAGAPTSIPMHRMINGTPEGFETDHKNHNTLDNRCSNLRTATKTQNLRNHGLRKDNSTGYKGVLFGKHRHSSGFMARITVAGKSLYLGQYKTAEEAAHAYDKASLEYHGEFACINFPEVDTN